MITWFAPYPKPSNTWLRGLLTSCQQDNENTADINKLQDGASFRRGQDSPRRKELPPLERPHNVLVA